MPTRSSSHGSPAMACDMPSPRKDATRIPPGASNRCISTSHALHWSVMWVKTENA
jgi:hypothetical protein